MGNLLALACMLLVVAYMVRPYKQLCCVSAWPTDMVAKVPVALRSYSRSLLCCTATLRRPFAVSLMQGIDWTVNLDA